MTDWGSESAKDLARLAAFLANRGSLGGQQLLSERAWEAMHDGVTTAGLSGDRASTHFSQGGINRYQTDDLFCCGRNGFWGWMGYGGSVFQWHPELRIGFSYVPTVLEMDLTNRRGGLLQAEVVRCVKERAAAIRLREAEEAGSEED